jgi:DNA-binding NtrC family response regulator
VDVLITDYKMPRFDGLQLMESAPLQVKKIVISGYVSDIAEEKLQKLNATFFEKPVPLRALAKIISEQQLIGISIFRKGGMRQGSYLDS